MKASLLRRVTTFRFGGEPLNMKGLGDVITREILSTRLSVTGEPMRVHALSGYISTLYLCEYPERRLEDGGLLMLDTGMPSDFDRVKFYVESVLRKEYDDKLELKDLVNLVVSTHCHIDHIGAGYEYAKHGMDVVVPSNISDYYDGLGGKMQQVIDGLLSMLFAKRLGRRPAYPFLSPFGSLVAPGRKPLPPLEDGMHLPGFPDWVALKCPGHTMHMVVLYNTQTRFLYCADFFVRHKNEIRAPVPVDLDYAFLHSMERLKKLDVEYALLAHGGIVNCEDLGGWTAIIDDIGTAMSREVTNPSLKAINTLLIGYSSEARRFSRDRLPRGPIPEPAPATESFTIHLR